MTVAALGKKYLKELNEIPNINTGKKTATHLDFRLKINNIVSKIFFNCIHPNSSLK